ncbi:MAG: hypothetical protein LW750_08400, partial [Bacteroidetes bacterium]|nr:hypothetical protein [Bacteroidota bacterium]
MINNFYRKALSFFAAYALFCSVAYSQTPGMIFEPATPPGNVVLDPNSNGWISISPTGFVSDDQTESELPYSSLSFPSVEPDSDLGPGPNCGFTDFVDQGDQDPAQSYYSVANNSWQFRIRLGGAQPNSKGYSILIDTDQRFGYTGPNADPNATTVNPGFEVEINLQTNFGVFIYNVDGVMPTLVHSYTGHSNYQKAIALTQECSDPDFFYDFFVYFTHLASVGITPTTPVRMAITTQMNPQPAIGNNALSDIAGVDDSQCGSPLLCWQEIIDNYPPNSPNSTPGADRSVCPTITTPIAVGATTVSGTSTEAFGSLIRVFKDNVQIGTTTVGVAGAWSLTSIAPPLGIGDTITASVQNTSLGELESYRNCQYVTPVQCNLPSYTATIGNKGVCGTAPTGMIGSNLRVYNVTNSTYPGITPSVTTWDVSNNGDYWWKCNGSANNCISGANTCIGNGGYWMQFESPAGCLTSLIFGCYGTGNPVSATPTVNSPVPLSGAITGTGPANGVIFIYVNNAFRAWAPISSAGTFSVTGINRSQCDVVTACAMTSNLHCVSAMSSGAVVGITSPAPTITGSYCTSSSISSVTGTSSAGAGAIIQVFNGATLLGTTTVNSSGSWTLNVSVLPGYSLTAKAQGSCSALSPSSSPAVIVQSATSDPNLTL